MDRKLNNIVKILACFSLLLVTWLIFGGPFNTYYLIWNLILAWVPMFFALAFNRNINKEPHLNRNIMTVFLSFAWLFFFPNAVYLITDYIHLSNDMFYYPNLSYTPYSGEVRTLYNFDLLPWNNLFSITFAVFLGCALSVLSLYIFHRYIDEKKGKKVGWVFVVAVHILSGYATYLGRFIRFNSWDVLFNTFGLIRFLFSNIDQLTVIFTVHFALLSLLIYSIFYLFIYLGKVEVSQ